nr:TonB-dependent receptor plug domain-containing protein [Novosphingobium sp. SG751A]
MRSLGALRTLILYDGHRVPPTTPDGQVNVDMIPQTLLQRVDLVTGGVSAVYGSDAMSGVVNFIPDTTFTGLKWNAQSGISQRGDDNSFQAGAAWGTTGIQ